MRSGDRAYIVRLGVLLVCVSAALYVIHYLIFRDLRTVLFYFVMDVAFLPVSVLVVGVIIESLLARRERRTVRNKLNMVIGAFFSEIGNRLLTTLTPAVDRREELREHLGVSGSLAQAGLRQGRHVRPCARPHHRHRPPRPAVPPR